MESDRGMKALAVRILRTERAAGSPVGSALPVLAPAGAERSDDDGMCDVLTPAGCPARGDRVAPRRRTHVDRSQIVQLRQSLTLLAQRHGWVEN